MAQIRARSSTSVKQRLGLSLGAIRKELRAFMGLRESTLPAYPTLPKVANDRIRVERTVAQTRIAQQRRWAKVTGEKPTPKAAKPKRKLSAAGRKAIVDALKKRWAAKKAQKA